MIQDSHSIKIKVLGITWACINYSEGPDQQSDQAIHSYISYMLVQRKPWSDWAIFKLIWAFAITPKDLISTGLDQIYVS